MKTWLPLLLICLLVGLIHADQSITVSWDANPEQDVRAYVVYYGVSPRIYPNATNVGNVTCATIHGLPDGQPIFMALTAVNAAGLESEFSNEITNALKQDMVRVILQSAITPAGPWQIMLETELPKKDPGQFFRIEVSPLWKRPDDSVFICCSNGILVTNMPDTNTLMEPAKPWSQ